MKKCIVFGLMGLLFLAMWSCKEKPGGIDPKPSLAVREIALRSRTFTPNGGIPQDLAERISKLTEQGKTDSKRIHMLMQFSIPIEQADKKRLLGQGIELLEPVGPHAWFVAVNQDVTAKLSANAQVLWADMLQVDDKLDAALRANPVPYDYQKRQGDRATYTLVFHRDVSAEQVQAMAKRVGMQTENFSTRYFSLFHTAMVEISSADLRKLAEEDMICWIEPSPAPDEDHNQVRAQPLSNVNTVQAIPFNLDGTGINVGIWEAGNTVYAAHLDLNPRVAVQAGQILVLDDHAAHVAGTIGASGVNVPAAEGMAPNVNMFSWDSNNDAAEMVAAAQPAGAGLPPQIDISSHSYGATIGWNNNGTAFQNNQNLFGQYNANAAAFDGVVANSNLIVCKSAGNDRSNVWNGVAVIPGFPAGPPPNDCQQSGFPGGSQGDCIEARACAKNAITVGAMNGAAAITTFSGYGPTDDGRIKPDLVAEGNNMLSTASNVFDDRNGDGLDDAPNTNTSSVNMSGTSMSTPVVSGICALLLEQADSMNIQMSSAGMKALLLQTATDVNGIGQSQVGPDYATGYGIADAEAASNLLRQNGLQMDTLRVTGAPGTWTRTMFVPAGLPELKVTLAWSDPAGNPAAAVSLVNDLDLVLLPPGGGAAVRPWQLNPANPALAAVRNGVRDAINNVEQVSVLAPASGVWTVQVSALAGALPGGIQSFGVAGILPNSDIVLVMDKSGSMNLNSGTPGVSKIAALRTAANEFVDLLDLTGGNNLSLVQFNGAVVPFAPAYNLQTLNAAGLAAAHTAINSISAGGVTNIISGVQEANNQLAAAATPAPRRSIVVFSDGKHNTPAGSNLADIGPIVEAGDYRFYSIGFGTDVDDAILSQVATQNHGIHVNEQDLNALQLTKYFLTVGALAHDLTVLSDPTFEVGTGETASLAVDVIGDDHSIIFALNWTGALAKDLEISLLSPDKSCRVPIKTGRGIEIRKGENYYLVKVTLPYDCNGRKVQPGQWVIQAKPLGIKGEAKESVDIMVLGHTAVRFEAQARRNRFTKQMQIVAALRGDRRGLSKLERSEVVAYLVAPMPETGDSQKQDNGSKETRNTTPKAKRTQEIPLLDDGKNGDGKAKDGIFTASLPTDLKDTGIFQARVVGRFLVGGQRVTREATISFYRK